MSAFELLHYSGRLSRWRVERVLYNTAPLAFLHLFQKQITVLGQIHDMLNLEYHYLQSQSSRAVRWHGQSGYASIYSCSPNPRYYFSLYSFVAVICS